MEQCLASIGLLLDVAGVLLVWKFGLPAHINRKGESAILQEREDPAEIQLAKTYDQMAHIGVALIVLGFLLQIAALWADELMALWA